MTKRTAQIIHLSDYRDYACIVAEMKDMEIICDRQRLKKLTESGLDFELFTEWLAEEFDDYYPYINTMIAFNKLDAWAQKRLRGRARKNGRKKA